MNVAEHRRAHGWTQTQLAEKVGTSPAYISQLETGHRNPSTAMIHRLAAAFGCSPVELMASHTGGKQ